MKPLYTILFTTILTCHGFQTSDICTQLKDEFAKAISEFTSCSINYSRPITLCENCVDTYINMLSSYSNLSEMTYNSSSDMKCIDKFVNLDRLQIVETQYSNSINLWTRAKCSGCYLVKNGTQTSEESIESKHLKEYYSIYNSCVLPTNSVNLCTLCINDYLTLTNYYTSINNVNGKSVLCVDLIDLMNTTQAYWSERCCKYRRHDEYIFIGATVAVFLVTILFYIIIQFLGEKRAPTIIQQTRFAESINNLRNT